MEGRSKRGGEGRTAPREREGKGKKDGAVGVLSTRRAMRRNAEERKCKSIESTYYLDQTYTLTRTIYEQIKGRGDEITSRRNERRSNKNKARGWKRQVPW